MKYNIIDKQTGIHEYSIIHSETNEGHDLYSLIASHGTDWTEKTKGNEFMNIIDNGNGLKISSKVKNLVDYAYVEQLRILLNFIQKTYGSNLTYNVIKEEAFIEI